MLTNAVAVASGDFNGDGDKDMAVMAGSSVEVLLANGSGGFTVGHTYTLPTTGSAIVVGHFISKTSIDIAVLTNGSVSPSVSPQVVVLPSNGDGTFGTEIDTTVGGGVTSGRGSMAVGDFNKDGYDDLAIASTGDGELRVLINSGSSTFSQTAYTSSGGSANLVAAADFTGDGNTDLAVFHGNSTAPTLTMFVNGGLGSFTQGTAFTLTSNANANLIAVGNFYGDGLNDIALWDASTGVTIIPPDGPHDAWQPDSIFYDGTGPVGGTAGTNYSLGVANLNDDGKDSLVIADGTGPVRVLMSNPLANQMLPATQTGSASPTMAAVASFTGRTTVVRYVGPNWDTSTLVGNSNGTWTRSSTDGSVDQFNSFGQEVSDTDRYANTTTYSYAASGGSLQSITDPTNRVTTFAYSSGHVTITDPALHVTTLILDSNGNLTQITDPDGAITQYGYSTPANHLITAETSPNNHTATVAYDSFNRFSSETLFDGISVTSLVPAVKDGLIAAGGSGSVVPAASYTGSLTDPNGHTVTLVYDAVRGRPLSVTDANVNTTTYSYNSNDWLASVVNPLNRGTSYAYDSRGDVTQITRADNSSASFAYDPTYAQLTSATDFNGRTTTFTLDSHGSAIQETDPDGHGGSFTYTAAGLLATATDRNVNTTTYAYDSYGRLSTVTEPSTGAGIATISYGYDPAGDVTSLTDELGHTTTFTYDAMGRVRTSQDPIEAAAGKIATFAYDADGNLTSTIDALGHITSYVYDSRDRLTAVVNPANQGTGKQYSYSYDKLDNVLVATDPLGDTTTYSYDPGNRLVSVNDPNGHVTTYGYDKADELTGVTDANGHAIAYVYDNLGRLQTETTPGNLTTTLAYDPNGNLTSATNPLGHIVTYAYDVLNQLTTVTSGGSLALTTLYGYDLNGNLTTVTDGLNHVATDVYDARDRLIAETQPSGGGTTSYIYDQASRLTNVTDPVGNVTSYAYDSGDRLTTLTTPTSTGGTASATYAYDVVGNITSSTDRDGRVVTYSYDVNNRQTGETWFDASGHVKDVLTYVYDADGQTTKIADGNATLTFVYDNAGQVTGAATSGPSGTQPLVTLSYGYDGVGDRTSMTDSLSGSGGAGQGITSYAYDSNNRLTTMTQSFGGTAGPQVVFGYDSASRLTSISRTIAGAGTSVNTSLSYDSADRLTTIVDQASRDRSGDVRLWIRRRESPDERDRHGKGFRGHVHV